MTLFHEQLSIDNLTVSDCENEAPLSAEDYDALCRSIPQDLPQDENSFKFLEFLS